MSSVKGKRWKKWSRHLWMESLERREYLSADTLLPVSGDFNASGNATTGYFDQVAGRFLLRDSAISGFAETAIRFGPKNTDYLPIVGDWDGDLDDSIGLYDPLSGTFYLKNSLDFGAADIAFRFGPKNDNWLPVAGDWDGDGLDTVGLYDPDAGRFYLRNLLAAGAADTAFRFGPKLSSWLPIVGDWNSNGVDSVGLFDPVSAKFLLSDTNLPGPADHVFGFGPKGQRTFPLSGDWNGDSVITVGVFSADTEQFYLRNTLTPGGAEENYYLVPEVDATPTALLPGVSASTAAAQLTTDEVETLLDRAEVASSSNDAIIAVVDRSGRILGIRTESDVVATITDLDTLVFAIDGAVAKARTAAFFANGDRISNELFDSGTGTPLTSRTIRFISQSTITQREVESNPNLGNPAEPDFDPFTYGPGVVAPIGLGGHFPPEIDFTPVVDLFAIEKTNRDGSVHPGADFVRGTPDDIPLASRFNVDPIFTEMGQEIAPPDSYGFQSGRKPNAQSRGIGTLPGGIPLFRDTNGDGISDTLVGGIGVFFPGPDGFATHEQGFIQGVGQTEFERMNTPKTLEAEAIALVAAGGSQDIPVGALPTASGGVVPAVLGIQLPVDTRTDRLTLVGIELEVVGPHPDGPWQIVEVVESFSPGDLSGSDQPVDPGAVRLAGKAVPEGWLVLPHASSVDDITAGDVQQIVANAIAEADQVRAAIRLPVSRRTKMVFAVADTQGEVLGLYRMPDATVFSIDVAVAKARNTAYYANDRVGDPLAIKAQDLVDATIPPDGMPDLPPGIAFSNRTFRFLAEPRFPDGIDGAVGPFSILNNASVYPSHLVDPITGGRIRVGAENIAGPADAATFTSVAGFDAFNPGSNFQFSQDLDPFSDQDLIANQNGIVFFPGSTPIYRGGTVLIGGFGVSGDGVDQDDVVTDFGARGFLPEAPIQRADEVFVRGVRLPFIKFLRNPEG